MCKRTLSMHSWATFSSVLHHGGKRKLEHVFWAPCVSIPRKKIGILTRPSMQEREKRAAFKCHKRRSKNWFMASAKKTKKSKEAENKKVLKCGTQKRAGWKKQKFGRLKNGFLEAFLELSAFLYSFLFFQIRIFFDRSVSRFVCLPFETLITFRLTSKIKDENYSFRGPSRRGKKSAEGVTK